MTPAPDWPEVLHTSFFFMWRMHPLREIKKKNFFYNSLTTKLDSIYHIDFSVLDAKLGIIISFHIDLQLFMQKKIQSKPTCIVFLVMKFPPPRRKGTSILSSTFSNARRDSILIYYNFPRDICIIFYIYCIYHIELISTVIKFLFPKVGTTRILFLTSKTTYV